MNETARAASQLALPVLLFALLLLLGQLSVAAPQALINVRLNDDLPPAGDLEAGDPGARGGGAVGHHGLDPARCHTPVR